MAGSRIFKHSLRVCRKLLCCTSSFQYTVYRPVLSLKNTELLVSWYEELQQHQQPGDTTTQPDPPPEAEIFSWVEGSCDASQNKLITSVLDEAPK